MIVFAAVLLALGGLLYALAVRARDLSPPEPVSPAGALREKQDAIYENLRDLQFEYRVGKLSDEDYQRSKLDLQKELTAVTAEIDGLGGAEAQPAAPQPAPPPSGLLCPKCGARFAQAMKFCGECGEPMSGGAA